MVDIKKVILQKLKMEPPAGSVRQVIEWLEGDGIAPLSDGPLIVSAVELARVWRVRDKISKAKGQSLEGAADLVSALEKAEAEAEIEQISFKGRDDTRNIFFDTASGRYLGTVLFARRPARADFLKAS